MQKQSGNVRQAPYSLGFSNVTQEVGAKTLGVRGQLPPWLRGALIRIAPALYDFGGGRMKHWMDGLGYLYKFELQDRRVSFQSRFVRSEAYRQAIAADRPMRTEYASVPHRSWLRKFRRGFRLPPLSDNCNANIISVGGQLAATSDQAWPLLFDPDTLATLGPLAFDDGLEADRLLPHLQYDEGGNAHCLLLRRGKSPAYLLFRLPTNGSRRELLAELKRDRLAYMHSLGMSERYVILTECPLVEPEHAWQAARQPFLRRFRWRPDLGTRLRVLDRQTGREVATVRTEAFFSFHHVNAFEEGDHLVVDQLVYPDASVNHAYYLHKLRSRKHSVVTAHLMRIHINLRTGKIEDETILSETCLELPAIHPAYYRQPYRFCYGVTDKKPGHFFDALVKIDLERDRAAFWQQKNCYPGEPVFVPRPGGSQEDEGVLLSVVLQTQYQRSFLLVLDARTMTRIARIDVPLAIPFGLHGHFFPRSISRKRTASSR